MICFDKVSKFVLSDISLHIPQGKTAGLIGASGAGKTTFLKLACGLLLPDVGNVYIMGKNPAAGRRGEECFLSAFFADKPLFDNGNTVRGNFEILGSVYRLLYAKFCRDYRELSERLDFGESERELVGELSLGMRRRAELGAALLCRPKLLILDEPFVGLDENAKLGFRLLLEERKKTENMTVVLSSHDMAQVSGLCDRFALLHRGRLLSCGEREYLTRSFLPREEMVLRISGTMPDLEDLPLEKYSFDGEELRVVFRSDFVTAAEILKFILRKCPVTQVSMSRPGLTEIVSELADRSVVRREHKNERMD